MDSSFGFRPSFRKVPDKVKKQMQTEPVHESSPFNDNEHKGSIWLKKGEM